MVSTSRAALCSLGLALCFIGCGGGSSGVSATSGDGGTTGADGGGDGGTPVGGGGTPGADGGAGGGGSGTDGGTATGGGSGGGGSDGGTGGGTGPTDGGTDPCAGLVPTLGAAVDIPFATGTHSICSVATSNPAGQVALGFTTPPGSTFHLYAPDGTAADGPAASMMNLQALSTDLDPWFHATGHGWRGIVHNPPPATGVVTWDAAGAPTSTFTGLIASAIAPDGRGGSVVVGLADDAGRAPHLTWLDADGAVAHDLVLDAPAALVVVGSTTGHVLVVTGHDGSNATARWFDAAGAPITASFDAGVALPANEFVRKSTLRPLVDGRFVLHDGSAWVAVFTDRAASVGPVPAWLAARPGKALATTPGGRAYVMTSTDPSVPTADAEVLTPSGQSCGSLAIPSASAPPGATRHLEGLFVGQDGTLFAVDVLSGESLGFGVHCAFRWWAGALR